MNIVETIGDYALLYWADRDRWLVAKVDNLSEIICVGYKDDCLKFIELLVSNKL